MTALAVVAWGAFFVLLFFSGVAEGAPAVVAWYWPLVPLVVAVALPWMVRRK